MEKKVTEMTLQEMAEESIRSAFEIAKLRSIIEKHQKRFNDLSYNIWLKQKDNETNGNDVSANTKNNK